MRLPAVAIVAAFASGIVLGLHPTVARNASSHILLSSLFLLVAFFVLAGIFFVRIAHLLVATIASLFGWILLGFLGVCIAEQPRDANHVISLVEQSRISLKTPLRWRGHLRDEPTRLPWGYGYEIELTRVEFEGAFHPARGGLRLSFTAHPEGPVPPELHAGDEVAVLAEAKRPQIFKDEGAFDRRAYLAQQNIDLVATLRAPQLIERISSSTPTIGTVLARARRTLRDEIDVLFAAAPQVAGVLRAMLLGDRNFVNRAEALDFQKTGVFHVLVVAGLHVGALAFALYWVGRKLRLSRMWTTLFTLTMLGAYVGMVEQRTPVLRAAMMAAIVVLGGFFFRRLELLNSAAVAAVILLLAKPVALRDSRFQLTFVAIGCIGGLALPWLEKTAQPYVRALRGWRDVTRDAAHEPRAIQFRIDLRSLALWLTSRLPQRLSKPTGDLIAGGLSLTFRVWELLVLTLALQAGMLPLMARDFHRIPLSAPLVNLAAVPLTGIVVPLGFLTLACGLVFTAAGKLLAVPLAWLTALLLHIVQWFAHFPRWSYRIPGPPFWLIVLFFAVGILLAAEMRLKHPLHKTMVWGLRSAFVACALTIAIYPFGERLTKGKLELTVLDVGQGDSLLVVTPGGKTLLIDGGGAFGGFPGHEEHNGVDPGEEAVSPYLWSRGFQKLDVVALTHAHQDHLGGLTAILENFRVAQLWIGHEVSVPALVRLEELARERKISIEHELRGKSFRWDSVDGEFLWPEIVPEELAPSAKNNDSLVLRLRYGNETLLLPGDAEKQVEREILSENDPEAMRADVLKIGHHGSKNSTTPEFLAAVQPRVGIISAGEDNPYGHPSPELLERLENAGIRILRTDQNGAVQVMTDGRQLEISCFVACPNGGNAAASVQGKAPDRKQD
ncbi:MAG: DNA internalization-related competence protein ComEC/Rec2 [Acidobacteria bacterium]|nr:MAG: DNA internalization-related competence protein ComEC/Rec2 [Acidobacteriota bacterium]